MPAGLSLANAVRNSVPATLADYIMVCDNVLSAQHCRRLIDRFEAAGQHQICKLEGGHSFSQLEITTIWPDEQEVLLPVFLAHFRKYRETTKAFFQPANLAFEHLRVKRYLPDGRDFFSPHVDVVDQRTAHRFFTAMIYLNAPEGGETVFPNLDLAVTPQTGRLLAFPPLWLFPHEGRPPRVRPKYILHTYLCYGS